jgi:hypothetical protein
MEIIKKTVLQALTTGTTTGCTGTCRIIIPDLTANYYFKICLTQETQDIGFFSAFVENDISMFSEDNIIEEVNGMGELLLMDEFFI